MNGKPTIQFDGNDFMLLEMVALIFTSGTSLLLLLPTKTGVLLTGKE